MSEPKLDLVPAPREDVHAETSQREGAAGILEAWLRRFRTFAFFALLTPLAMVCCLAVGLAVAPGLYVFDLIRDLTLHWITPLRYAAMGVGVALGYLTYGISLIFIVPAVNFLNPLKPRPFRGPMYSLPAIGWYIHNGLTYMVRLTFLEMVTPTPLNMLFYRMMGMKMGKGVLINTTHISDPCMITLGDYVTVGGSATIFAHYGQKGYLIIAPVTIGKGTNVGLKASVMGGAEVGENVTIKPHTVILPKTKVPSGTTI